MRASANWCRKKSFAYAVTGENGSMMGVVDLFKNDQDNWEIGYWIGKEFWGKGYISEAAKGLLREYFRCII